MTLTEALARVWGRILYNQECDEQHGPNWHRGQETEAFYLVLDLLSDQYSDEVAGAEGIARERHQQRWGRKP